MKRLILLLNFVLLFAFLYSQDQVTNGAITSKNAIEIFSNVGICEITKHQEQQWIVSAHGKAVFQYGLGYIRTFSHNVKLETGIFFSKYTIVNHVIEEPNFNFYATEYFDVISVPIIFRYYFPKSFYISGGTILDLVTSQSGGWSLTDSQNGFALGIGAGKEINVNRFSIYFEPNFYLHAAIPFSGNLTQQKLFIPGIKIGIIYHI